MEIHISREDAQHTARDAQDVGRQSILRRAAEARTDNPPGMTTDEELLMTHAKTMKTWEFDIVRSKVFSLNCIRSVLIAKLKVKGSQKHKCINIS